MRKAFLVAVVVLLVLPLACAMGTGLVDEARAQYDLGNYEEAFALYLQAAEAGDAKAIYNVGALYARGEGVEEDDLTALEWFKKAAEMDYPDALYTIGNAYSFGNYGLQIDYGASFSYCLRAAQLGNAKAMFAIGNMYDRGIGIAEDKELAVQWYQKASMLGNASATYNLASKYLNGEAVQEDPVFAGKMFERAAELGSVSGMVETGHAYHYGRYGMAVDYAVAAQWYQKGVDQGDAHCMRHLAELYASGLGVEKDIEQARTYYLQAQEAGEDVAAQLEALDAQQ